MATTLILGGARSGKSRLALELASPYRRRGFLATAEPLDDEMRRRIETHRRERAEGFRTLEEPIELAGALQHLTTEVDVVVVDCLTVWLGNLLHRARRDGEPTDPSETFPEIAKLFETLERGAPCDLILVSNEVGMGVVPAHEMGRTFRDLAGRVHQRVAAVADRVLLAVAGLPLEVKQAP